MSERLEPVGGVHPAPAGPVLPILLTPAERDAERRRRERARAARRDAREDPEDAAGEPRDQPSGRLDVRG